jgi:hypothetical protein
VPVLVVFDHEKLGGILRGKFLELFLVLRKSKGFWDVFEVGSGQIDFVGEKSTSRKVIDLLMRQHGKDFGLEFIEGVIVSPEEVRCGTFVFVNLKKGKFGNF